MKGLRIEDVLLAGWNVAGIPLIVAAGGVLTPVLALGSEPNTFAGIVQLTAVVAAIVAIATRPAGAPPMPDLAGAGGTRLAFIGPLVGAVAFVSGSVSAYLGLGIDGLIIGVTFVVIVGAMLAGDRLPVVPAAARRALMLPFVFVCNGIFNGFAAGMLDGLDVGELIAAATVDETGFGLFVLGMLVAGLAAFYVALIVAPRMLVNPEQDHAWLAWPIRFALFLASAALGIWWLAAL